MVFYLITLSFLLFSPLSFTLIWFLFSLLSFRLIQLQLLLLSLEHQKSQLLVLHGLTFLLLRHCSMEPFLLSSLRLHQYDQSISPSHNHPDHTMLNLLMDTYLLHILPELSRQQVPWLIFLFYLLQFNLYTLSLFALFIL